MSKHWLAACGLLSIFAGCAHREPPADVQRVGEAHAMPAPECVRRVLGSVPGVARVVYAPHDDDRPPGDVNYVFVGARNSNVGAYIHLHRDDDGTVTFVDRLSPKNLYLNRQPDADASRPLMACIERRLEQECALGGLTASIHESCQGVDCPALAASCAPPSRQP